MAASLMRRVAALLVLALIWAAVPAAALAQEAVEEVDRSATVSVQGYLQLGSSSWSFSPSCVSAGTAGPYCGLNLAGSYDGEPAGTAGGCLARRKGVKGAGSFFVLDTMTWEPRLDFDISDFGWDIADGWGSEAAVVRGKWTDGQASGRIEGVLASSSLSTYCDYFYVSGVIQFVPDEVPADPAWGSRSPAMPMLIAPDEGHEFLRESPKNLTIRAEDPDGDAYVGLVAVTHADTNVTTTFVTSAAASGAESSGPVLALEPGTYTWTAQACDPGGSRECSPSSTARSFQVVDNDTVDEAEGAVDRSPSVYVQGYMELRSGDWRLWPSSCLSGGTASASCTFNAAGTYGPEPAGTLGGCLSQREGTGGAGDFVVYDELTWEPALQFDVSDLGWSIAEGYGYEAALVHGSWSDPESGEQGNIEGALSSFSLSTYCDYYYVSGVLDFVPEGTPRDPAVGNQRPEAPVLVAPGDDAHFTREAPKRLTIRATDPDDDDYVGIVTVTGEDGVARTFATTVAESGADAWGDAPVSEPGTYTWTAQACDPSGARECGPPSATQRFTVDPAAADQAVEDMWDAADHVPTITVSGYLDYSNGAWRMSRWNTTCQHAGSQWVRFGGACTLDLAGTYGSEAPIVNGGCLSVTGGRSGSGTLTNHSYSDYWTPSVGPTYQFGIEDLGWTASGLLYEAGTVSGRWLRGGEKGRIEGYVQTTSSWSGGCYVQMVLQIVPPSVPEWPVPGNAAPGIPQLVLPEPYHTYRLGQVHQFSIRAEDPEQDPYHGELEVTVREGYDWLPVKDLPGRTSPAASGQLSTVVFPGYLPPGEYRWRARACDPSASAQCGEWSGNRFFTVREEEVIPSDLVEFEQVYQFTGTPEPFVVPKGVEKVEVEAWGASSAGAGGHAKGTIAVTPGEVLTVFVGGQPNGRTGGFNGGGSGGAGGSDGANCGTSGASGSGGAGASDVRQGGVSDGVWVGLDNRRIVAGGGGGSGGGPYAGYGGSAGGYSGSSGGVGRWYDPQYGYYNSGWGGSGGSGGWGGYGGSGSPESGGSGTSAIAGSGGAGGGYGNNDAWAHCGAGGGGGGGGGGGYGAGGGGGGGQRSSGWKWKNKAGGGGGGGGASYVDPGAEGPFMEGGVRWGQGVVILRWEGPVYDPTVPQLRYPYSDEAGLENFYPYRRWDLGTATGFLNLANGNLVVQDEGLRIPGPLNLRLTHTYNRMRDQRSGPLGRGWTLGVVDGEGLIDTLLSAVMSMDINRTVEIVGTEDIFELFDGDGTRHHFVKGGLAGPGWHSPPGVDLTLTDGIHTNGQRWYHATRHDGVRYEFESFGDLGRDIRLTKIADRKGNAVTLTYSGSKLSHMTDNQGRTLTLTWAGNYVTRARLQSGAQFIDTAYDIDTAADRLTSVTKFAGTVDAQATSFAYLGDEGMSGVTDPRGAITSFTYDDTRLRQLVDRAGKSWGITYEDDCSVESKVGQRTVCVTDPEGHMEASTSSSAGNLLLQRDAGDADEGGTRHNQRRYVWKDNRVVRWHDESGNTTYFTYDDFGRIVQHALKGVGEEPVVTELTYANPTQPVADIAEVRAAAGTPEMRLWKFTHDERGLPISQTDPAGAVTTMAYNASGLLTNITDPRGNVTTYANYDPSAQPGKITDATGAAATLVYDWLGREVQRTDRVGAIWRQTWDLRGNLLTRTDPLDQTTRFCYDVNGNRVLEIRPKAASTSCAQTGTEGHVTRFSHDARDLRTTVLTTSDGQRRRTEHVYGDDGQVVETRYPRSFDAATHQPIEDPEQAQVVRYDRFPNNRIRSYTDPEGNTTQLLYHPTGLVWRVTEPGQLNGGRVVTYTYNGRRQETAVLVSGHTSPARSEYNVHGELVRRTSPQGRVTQYVHDAMGRPVKEIDGHGRVAEREYDATGNLVRLTQPSGLGATITTTFGYTVRNEIAWESDPADTAHRVRYAYDGEGRQISREDQTNGVTNRTIQQTRRADGRVTEKNSSFALTTSGQHRVTYGYDAHGNVTSLQTMIDGTASPSVSIGIAYTSADEPSTWDETVAGVTKRTTFAYERDGLLSRRTVDGKAMSYAHLRNGLERSTAAWQGDTVTFGHVPSGLPASIAMPDGVDISFAWDLAGRLSAKTERMGGTTNSSWSAITYDQDDLRTSETVTMRQVDGTELAGAAGYGYDNLGRLVAAKHAFEPSTVQYVLDDAGNVISDGATASTYVDNRLLEQRPLPAGTPTTFTYDERGNMTAQVTGTDRMTYTYDAAGHPRRVAMPDGSWVEFLYDAFDRPVRRHTSEGELELLFHDRDGQAVALETDASGAAITTYVLDPNGKPLGQEHRDTGMSWFSTDLRDNVTQVHNSSGVKATYAYDPYGREKAALGQSAAGHGSRLRFQMARHDPKLGVYNLGPRLYDPNINRFVGADFYVAAAANMDLALDPLTGNRYLYAGANPANLIDDGYGWCRWSICNFFSGLVNSVVNWVTKKMLQGILGERLARRLFQHPELLWMVEGVAKVKNWPGIAGAFAGAFAQVAVDTLFWDGPAEAKAGRAILAGMAAAFTTLFTLLVCGGWGAHPGCLFLAGGFFGWVFTTGADSASRQLGYSSL